MTQRKHKKSRMKCVEIAKYTKVQNKLWQMISSESKSKIFVAPLHWEAQHQELSSQHKNPSYNL